MPDPGVHEADPGVHDGPIWLFTIGRSKRSRWSETRTLQRKSGPSRPARQWDEASFIAALGKRCAAPEVAVAREILRWGKAHATRIYWGRGKRDGSFVPVLDHGETDYPLFAVYSYGALEIYFQYYLNRPAFAEERTRIELLGRLNAIVGFNIPADGITRRPSVPLELLTQEDAVPSFLAVFEWFIERVRTFDA